jgi:hypothetical protein
VNGESGLSEQPLQHIPDVLGVLDERTATLALLLVQLSTPASMVITAQLDEIKTFGFDGIQAVIGG